MSLRNAKIFHNKNITLCESPNAQEPFPSIEGDLPDETDSNLDKKDIETETCDTGELINNSDN